MVIPCITDLINAHLALSCFGDLTWDAQCIGTVGGFCILPDGRECRRDTWHVFDMGTGNLAKKSDSNAGSLMASQIKSLPFRWPDYGLLPSPSAYPMEADTVLDRSVHETSMPDTWFPHPHLQLAGENPWILYLVGVGREAKSIF